MLRPIWSHPECPTKEDIRESSGATDYPLLVAVSSGTNPCSGRRCVCNDLRQGYWRGLKLLIVGSASLIPYRLLDAGSRDGGARGRHAARTLRPWQPPNVA